MARVVTGSGTAAPLAVGAAMVAGLPNGVAVTPRLHGPAPTALTASTRKEYAVPSVSPVNVVDVADPASVRIAEPLAGAGLISAV